jgi:hypothetical protein
MGRGGKINDQEIYESVDIQRIGFQLESYAALSPSLAYVRCTHDWGGIYRDRVLIHEGHLNDGPSELFTRCQLNIQELYASEDWLEEWFRSNKYLPSSLREVKVDNPVSPLPYGPILVEVSTGDWFAIYHQRQVVIQGHLDDFDIPELFQAIRVPLTVKEADSEWFSIQPRQRLPEDLSLVKSVS